MSNDKLSLVQALQEIQDERRLNRQRERNIAERAKTISGQPLISSTDIKGNLKKILPKHLAPTNIGKYNEVLWPFFFVFKFDFGTDPTYTPTTRQVQTVQIDQEASFLLTGISRSHNSKTGSGFGAPLQLTIRDNQSSRQFNDSPIPLQAIGYSGKMTKLETPLYLAPNATLSLEMSSWLPTNFATTGSGYTEIVAYGMRVRSTDASKVLTSIFA